MRILFIVHDGLTMPLGISYLAAIAEKAGHHVYALALSDRNIHEYGGEYSPDLIAFGSTTGFHRKYLKLVEPLKRQLNVPVIMGGAHPTFFPEVFENNPWIDYAMRGEADMAFLQFLLALKGSMPMGEVGNLLYREDGQVRFTQFLPLVEDLDTVPFPKRDLLPGANRKAVFCITGRGCPYDCTYCFNHTYRELYREKGTYCRRRSVDNVLQEIIQIRKGNDELQMIVFQDDIFIMDHDWVREFCSRYPVEVGLPFHCHLRANLVSREITELLAGAGCISVKMAVESTNQRLLNHVLGRNLTPDVLREACMAVKESGIKLVSQNILAIPTSTLEDDLNTLKFNWEVHPDFAFATLMQPYPRTEICRFCIEEGLMDGSETIPDSFFDDSVLNMKDMKARKRLRNLFALSIEFKPVRWMLPLLLKLPLDPFYSFLDKLWKGYCIKQREFPYKLTLKEYFSGVLAYFRSRYY